MNLSAKLDPRALSLAVTTDLRVIFIILIIILIVIFIIQIIIFLVLILILNLHDPDLSGSSCNAKPKSLVCGLVAKSCHESVITK